MVSTPSFLSCCAGTLMRSHSLIRNVLKAGDSRAAGNERSDGDQGERGVGHALHVHLSWKRLHLPARRAGDGGRLVFSIDRGPEHLADLQESIVALGAVSSKIGERHRAAVDGGESRVVGSGGGIAFDSNDSRLVRLVRYAEAPIAISLDGDSEAEHFPQSDVDIGPADEFPVDLELETGRQQRTYQQKGGRYWLERSPLTRIDVLQTSGPRIETGRCPSFVERTDAPRSATASTKCLFGRARNGGRPSIVVSSRLSRASAIRNRAAVPLKPAFKSTGPGRNRPPVPRIDTDSGSDSPNCNPKLNKSFGYSGKIVAVGWEFEQTLPLGQACQNCIPKRDRLAARQVQRHIEMLL